MDFFSRLRWCLGGFASTNSKILSVQEFSVLLCHLSFLFQLLPPAFRLTFFRSGHVSLGTAGGYSCGVGEPHRIYPLISPH